MDKKRRQTMTALGGGAAVLGLLGPMALSSAKAASKKKPVEILDAEGQIKHQTLPYVKLDPDKVAEMAYHNYYKGDCMYGVFATIVEALAEKVGEPFTSYPKTVTRFGAGGVMGWATLCGAANGAAMAIYLVSENPVPLIDEVFSFYAHEPLPSVHPKSAKKEIKASVAGSTLCHVSVSNWCEASGVKSFHPDRAERCAQVVASVAKYTAEVLNAQLEGKFKPAYPIPAEVMACRSCHDKGGELENTRGKMDCGQCHTEQTKDHP